MREFNYENQGTNTYLVYEIQEEDFVDSMSLGMLTNNKIRGLAQTVFMQMDNKRFIKFNISSKVSVEEFFERTVSKKRLLGVFTGIVNAMLAAEDYMLDPATILLDKKYIYTDVSSCETDLICLPVFDMEAKNQDLGQFFRNIMFSVQFNQSENCDYIAKIINYLNGTPMFSLSDFQKLLEGLVQEKIQPVVTRETVPQKQVQPSVAQAQPAVPQLQPAKAPQAAAAPRNAATPPVQPKVPDPVSANSTPTQAIDSEISFFYLMQHYNKDNAAAYKAQKEARKEAKKKNKGADKPKVASEKKQKKDQPVAGFGFSVPGQATPPQVTGVQPVVSQGMMSDGTGKSVPQQDHATCEPPKGSAMNFGETTVLGGAVIGETTVLMANSAAVQRMVMPYLIRIKNNEKIQLNKPVFRVGKERSYVDYFVGDNTAISRSHANFITRDGRYAVVDTNSTNHTFVNGTMINSNEEVEIFNGDRIRLANEDFEFKIL